jgi:hypothetical protein
MLDRGKLLGLALASIVLLAGASAGAQNAAGAAAEATRHLQAGMSAASAGRWETALAEYSASNAATPSVVALDGLANAHYQLHHDKEARGAYANILSMNVQIPPGDTATQQAWAQTQSTAQQRVAEIDARAQNAQNVAAPPPPPPVVRDTSRDADEVPKRVVRTANNSIFLELLGNGLLYSINYERFFEDSGFSVRGGFSYISLSASAGNAATGTSSAKATFMTFPLLGNYYVGGRDHKLQLGLGVTFMYAAESAGGGGVGVASVSGFVPAPTAVVGYRYIPHDGGFAFFIGLTPFIVPGGDKSVLPWGGMSFGGVF